VVSIGPPAPADVEAPKTEKKAAPDPDPAPRAPTPQPIGVQRPRVADDRPKPVDPPRDATVARAPRWFTASTVVVIAVIATAVWALVAGQTIP
jgi:hypothetical protein